MRLRHNQAVVACPREVDGEPCEADVVVTIDGNLKVGACLEECESACGHGPYTPAEEAALFEDALWWLGEREREYADLTRDEWEGRT